MKTTATLVVGLLAAGAVMAQFDPGGAQLQDVMGDNYYELPADASDADRRQYSRAVTRGLLTYISTSYNNKKRALDNSWANGEIDSPAREAALAALNESNNSLRSQVHGSGYEDMVVDELLIFAQQTMGNVDTTFDPTNSVAGSRADTQHCQCFKTRYLDAASRANCNAHMSRMDSATMAELPRMCRSVQIDDPLADALATCTSYQDSFAHELTGEQMTRQVSRVGGECRYNETMPGNYLLACRWTDRATVAEMANYFRYAEFFTSARVSSHTEFVDGQPVTRTSHMLDGQPWDNPMQASIDSGQCKTVRR